MIKINKKPNNVVLILLIFGLFSAFIIAGGFWWYGNPKKLTRKTWEETLDSIAELKKNQIFAWRQERMNDALVISGRPIVEAYLQAKEFNDNQKQQLKSQLQTVSNLYDYDDVLLLNKNGEVLLSVNDRYLGELNESTLQLVRKALAENKIIFSSFYQCRLHNKVLIDLIAPVVIQRNNQDEILGGLCFIIDPGKFLYPLIQSWPTPSFTAETLLVSRQNNEVIFLNKLRHSEAAPLTPRFPLTEKSLPAAHAIQRWSEALEGRDYRGIPVLAVNKAIPDSSWRMVAKIDLAEIDQPLYREARLIIVGVISLVLLVGVVLAWTLTVQKKRHYESLYHLEQERQAIRTHFDYLVKYANDIILLMDQEGYLKEANDRAVVTYGYTRDKLLQLNIQDLMQQDQTPALFKRSREDLAGEVKIYEVSHRRQDGSVFPAEVSVNLIQLEGKDYFQEIIRDISERKLAEEALAQAQKVLDIRNRVAEVFLTVADDEMYAGVLAIILKALQSEFGVFGYLDETGNLVVPTMTRTIWDKCQVTDKTFTFRRETWGNSSWPQAIQEKRTISSNNPSLLTPEGHVPIIRHISLPIIHQNEVVGLIQVANKETDYTAEDIALLETISSAIAPVLSARLQAERQKAARLKTEVALREAYKCWNDIFQAIGHPTLVLAPNRTILRANRAATVITGKSAAELVGRKCFEIFHPDICLPPEGCPFEKLLASGNLETTEMEMPALRGTFLISCTPVFSQAGQLEKVFHIAADITSLKQAQEELLLKGILLDVASDSIFLHDLEGHFLYVNEAAWRDRGYEKDELLAKDLSVLIAPEFAGEREALLQDLITRGEIIFESAHCRKDGSILPVEIHARIIDLGGRQCVLSVARDLTERKRAEDNLRREKLLSDNIIDSLPGVFYFFDDQRRFRRWNAEFQQVTGYTATEFAGLTPLDLIADEDRNRVDQSIREVFATGVSNVEAKLITKDGHRIPYFFTGSRLELDGTPCLIGMGVDITERKQSEAALQKSEERFRNIAENTMQMIWEVDRHGMYTYCSPIVERLLGFKPEEVLGKNFYDFFHSDDREKLKEAAFTVFESKKPFMDFINRNMKRDGEIVWLSTSGVPILSERGDLEGYRGIDTDITDRKQAEEALALHAKRLQALLDLHLLADAPREQLLDFILEASVSTMQSEVAFIGLLDAAESTMTIHRWSKDAMAQCTIDDRPILFPVSQAGSWGECIRRRQAVLINDYQAPHVGKKGLPEGHLPIRRFLAVPILAKGRVVIAAAVANKATDYTENDIKAFTTLLNKMWEILKRREAEEAIQVLVNRAPLGIYIVQDGRFKMINPGFSEIVGYFEDELIGKESLDLATPPCREEVRQNAVKMLQGKSHRPYEFSITTKGGETKWVVESVASTIFQGRRAVLGYFLDITEQKKMEGQYLQAQKMEAVGRLAGGVAHDFNNMLSVISGYCELMQLELHEDDPLSRNLAEIKQAAQRAATLTQQLLAFSRKQIIKPEVINLNTKIANLEKMLRRLIGEDIDLAVGLESSLQAVKADPGQIDQILMNLVVNARDAMPQGGKLTLETANVYLDETYLRTHAYVIPGSYVMLAVSDNGQGMDAAILTRIFEPFFTTKEDDRGTGLGLATVYGIVKQNNGYIQVYSEIGCGTTFKIYLPSTHETTTASQPEIFGVERLYGSETILVVEDEDLVRNFICRSLKVYGYNVLEARHGGEALLQCERYLEPIHLIITDVVMPQMSGRELVDRLKPLRPDLKVLYMSGYTANAVVHHGVVEATVAFIQKPFPVKTLVEKIRQILNETIR